MSSVIAYAGTHTDSGLPVPLQPYRVPAATFAGLGLSATAVTDGYILAKTINSVVYAAPPTGPGLDAHLIQADSAQHCVDRGCLLFASSGDATASGG